MRVAGYNAGRVFAAVVVAWFAGVILLHNADTPVLAVALAALFAASAGISRLALGWCVDQALTRAAPRGGGRR